MADAILSGYKAGAQTVVFSGTQTLVSLADNEFTDYSDPIDNSSTKYMMADIEVYADFATTAGTTGDEAVEIYLIPDVTGTYPTWTGNVITDQQENNQYYIGSVTIKQSAATDRAVLRNVALPNGSFRFAIRNRANGAFDSTGSTLKWRPHQYSSA